VLLLFATAWAGVSVDDPLDCLDAGRLENELALQLGDAALADLDVRVTLTPGEPTDAAGGFSTSTRVSRDGERLWAKRSAFVQADCPALPEALALSIQQGLAGVPGFGVHAEESPVRVGATIQLVSTAGLPLDPRLGVHGGLKLRAGPFADLWTQARLQTGPRLAIGSGAATLFQPGLAVGLAVHERDPERLAPRWRPDAWALVWGGPMIAVGAQFDRDRVVVLPRVAAEVGAGLRVNGPVHVGLFAEVPILRNEWIVEDPNAGSEGLSSRTEPPIRIGLAVGLDFSHVR
jgi:hypothetical protein